MNPLQFVRQLQDAWDKPMNAEQAVIYSDKAMRFTDAQLDAIFDKLLETCKFQPKVSDVFNAATDLALLAKPTSDHEASHNWVKTNCPLCEGEGRLCAIFQTLHEITANERRKTRRFIDVGPYSDARWIGHEWDEGYATYIFRCCCDSGDVPTIPKAYPRWDTDRHGRPAQQVQQPDTVPVYGMRSVSRVIQQYGDEVPF